MTTRPIYVFIDESGNLDFSGSGTDHFVLSAFITHDPLECGRALQQLTYEFLGRGLEDQIPFHATSNSVGSRRRVLETLCNQEHHCRVHSIVADKHLAHPSKHPPEVFYGLVGRAMANYLLRVLPVGYAPVVLMFDSALTGKLQGAFLKALKPDLNRLGRPYRVMFRSVKHDVNGQIADFYAWAIFRKLEAHDMAWAISSRGDTTSSTSSHVVGFATGERRPPRLACRQNPGVLLSGVEPLASSYAATLTIIGRLRHT